LVDRIKAVIPWTEIGKVQLTPLYALVIGIVVAFVARIDVLLSLGFETVPVIGYIITGIVVSGGSSAVHELIAKLRESRGSE
jgi:hypothetical protein